MNKQMNKMSNVSGPCRYDNYPKNCISLDNLQSQYLLNSVWNSGDEISTRQHFIFSVPSKKLLGFAEDYKKFG